VAGRGSQENRRPVRGAEISAQRRRGAASLGVSRSPEYATAGICRCLLNPVEIVAINCVIATPFGRSWCCQFVVLTHVADALAQARQDRRPCRHGWRPTSVPGCRSFGFQLAGVRTPPAAMRRAPCRGSPRRWSGLGGWSTLRFAAATVSCLQVMELGAGRDDMRGPTGDGDEVCSQSNTLATRCRIRLGRPGRGHRSNPTVARVRS